MLCLAVFLAAAAAAASASYVPSMARDMVYLSGAAYCSKGTIESWNCGPPCRNVTVSSPTYCYDEGLNVAGYVGLLNSGDIIVSFRGTKPSSLKDWIDDLKYAKKTPFPSCASCGVHSGFYDSWNALKSQVISAVNNLGSSRSIYVTGHSLGAAIADLCSYDLAVEGYAIAGVYTYGQPRVGDSTYSSTYAATVTADHYRVVHWEDIVPHLPLEAMGFHHVSVEVFYNEDSSSYTVCNGSGEDPECSDGNLIDLSISDHLHYLNIPISGMCSVPSFAEESNSSLRGGRLQIVTLERDWYKGMRSQSGAELHGKVTSRSLPSSTLRNTI